MLKMEYTLRLSSKNRVSIVSRLGTLLGVREISFLLSRNILLVEISFHMNKSGNIHRHNFFPKWLYLCYIGVNEVQRYTTGCPFCRTTSSTDNIRVKVPWTGSYKFLNLWKALCSIFLSVDKLGINSDK